jgi:hypothetical protein
MITQTTLSAAGRASTQSSGADLKRRRYVPSAKSLEARPDVVSVAQALLFTQRYEGPARFCHAQREEPPHTALSLKPKILIANLELEFGLTHRRISLLEISNRKYLRVLHSPWRIAVFQPVLQLARHPSSIRSLGQPHRRRQVTTIHRPARHLIHGCAIKTPRNSLNIRYLHFSNRR